MNLSTRERLLLAQAVYEYGNTSWEKVGALLASHPLLLDRGLDPVKFNPENCASWYLGLMAAEQLEPGEDGYKAHAPHLQLAQACYRAHSTAIRAAIQEGEVRFRTVVTEIEQIRSGQWDEKIRAENNLPHIETPAPPAPTEDSKFGNPLSSDNRGSKSGGSQSPQITTMDTTVLEGGSSLSSDATQHGRERRTIDSLTDIPTEGSPATGAPMEDLIEDDSVFNDAELFPGAQERRVSGDRTYLESESVEEGPQEWRKRGDSEPFEDDGTPLRRTRQSTGLVHASKRFHNLIGMLLAQISQHRNGNIFHNPIRPAEAPDYHDIVKRPMDLKSIKGRIRDNVITDSQHFQRDIYLMFMNAMMYNRPHSDIYKMAQEMMLESEGQIQTFIQTEGWRG